MAGSLKSDHQVQIDLNFIKRGLGGFAAPGREPHQPTRHHSNYKPESSYAAINDPVALNAGFTLATAPILLLLTA